MHNFIPEEANKEPEIKENTQSKENSKLKENNKLSATGKYILTKKPGPDIRKSKIFDKSVSSDKYLRLSDISASKRRASKTPEQKKKIFGQSLTATTQKQNLKDLGDTNSPEGDTLQYDDKKR